MYKDMKDVKLHEKLSIQEIRGETVWKSYLEYPENVFRGDPILYIFENERSPYGMKQEEPDKNSYLFQLDTETIRYELIMVGEWDAVLQKANELQEAHRLKRQEERYGPNHLEIERELNEFRNSRFK